MEEFKDFVSRYPKLREEVVGGKKTWQGIYEDWVIMGENSDIWRGYEATTPAAAPSKGEDLISVEGIKKVMGYVKKINPDSITKTLNTVQKILQVTQGFGGMRRNQSGPRNNSWWD
jgi:hypothetical protein